VNQAPFAPELIASSLSVGVLGAMLLAVQNMF